MAFFTQKIWHIINTVVAILFQLANFYFGDIITFEIENKVAFNWKLLFTNKWFWIWLILCVAYMIPAIVLSKKDNSENDAFNQIYDDAHKKLLDAAVKNYQQKDFENGDNLLKSLDKVEEKRKQYSKHKTKKKYRRGRWTKK